MVLDFRASYNSSLINMIECLSCWDEFVDEGISKYFNENFIIDETTQKYISKYVEIRLPFGWENETAILNWAYEGFDKGSKFAGLLPSVEYLKTVKNTDGVTLFDFVKQYDGKMLEIKDAMVEKYNGLQLSEYLHKIYTLFGEKNEEKTFPCYLTISPIRAICGGANGEGVYSQVAVNSTDEKIIFNTFSTIVHEVMHKVVDLSSFINSVNNAGDDLYDFESGELLMGTLDNFIEEVIIHTLCDVLIFNDDPVKLAKSNYEKQDGSLSNRYYGLLWTKVGMVSEIIKDFLNGVDDKENSLTKIRIQLGVTAKA